MEGSSKNAGKALASLLLMGLAMMGNASTINTRYYDDPNNMQVVNHSLQISRTFGRTVDETFQTDFMIDLIIPSYVKTFMKIVNEKRQGGGDDFQKFLEALFKGVSSNGCKGHILEWIWRAGTAFLKPEDIKIASEEQKWVLHMFDSWGKPPEGVLSGHVNAYGDFDECIEIKTSGLKFMNPVFNKVSESFEGRYCTVYAADYKTSMGRTPVKVEKPNTHASYVQGNESGIGVSSAVSLEELLRQLSIVEALPIIPTIGVCMPNSCVRDDVQQVLVNIVNMLYAKNLDKLGKSYPEGLVWPHTLACYVQKKPDFDAADISVMTLIGGIALLCLVSGIIDFALNHGVDKPPRRGLVYKYFMAFSLYTNIQKWMSTRKGGDDLGCLHGIRFFSTAWVVLAHTYYAITFLPQWNMVDVKTVYEDWSVLTVINSTFAVDTFFTMSGMLVTYNILKVLDKTKGKVNILMLYLHRYLRLTPTYAILIGIMATIIPYLGNGPYWAVMNRWGEICENNWWTNLLYVNNLVNTSWLCQGEAWYLANDMQFYVLSPFIIYPLWKWEMIGAILLAAYTVLSCASPALLVHFYDTTPTTIPTRDIGKWFTHIYIRPYARIQTFLVGVWLAWILRKTKGCKLRLNPAIVLGGWLLSTAIVLTVLYSIQDWFDPNVEIPKVAGLAYAGLSRFGWGISMAWVMFACIKGYGGLINTFLSWSVFMPLGRLCYCVYLVSLHLQMILHIRFTQPIRYDSYTQINFFFAHMLMSFIVGFFCTLLFESPFMILQKLIFEGGGPPPAQQIPVKPPPKRYGIFYNNTDAMMNGGPVGEEEVNSPPTEANKNKKDNNA